MQPILNLQQLPVNGVDDEQFDLVSDLSDHCSGWNPSGVSHYCCVMETEVL